MSLKIKPVTEADRPWIKTLMAEHWGSHLVVSRGRLHQPDTLPGFVAEQQGQKIGLATYRLEDGQGELISLNSLVEGQGVGSALIGAVRRVARQAGCTRLWLITTNDNLEALRFYQKRGFELVQVHRNAVELSRQLKPEIPLVGNHDIPIRDEIELELIL
jgi:N-acetylglutamate synthase-like GNAT family acetyltransferase